MGGEIAVDSQLGKGSRFTVALTLSVAGAASGAVIPDHRGLSVLLVSHAPFEAAYLAEIAGLTGALIRQTGEPADAQGMLLAHPVDVLMVDLSVGAERARELAILARAAGVGRRIIILSPFERRSFGAPAAAGFDAFLVKPVRGRSLLAQLRDRGQPAGAEATSLAQENVGKLVERPRVLLAEDNEINALLARRTLEKLGADPVWARNGQEAVDLMMAALSGETAPFALGVFDVRMPIMDGLKAARMIRDEEVAMAVMHRLPLIAVTANVSAEDRQAAMAAGFDDCLPKPLVRDQLALWLKLALDPAQAGPAAGTPTKEHAA
jgi:CheY-like chemotaxis protein